MKYVIYHVKALNSHSYHGSEGELLCFEFTFHSFQCNFMKITALPNWCSFITRLLTLHQLTNKRSERVFLDRKLIQYSL